MTTIMTLQLQIRIHSHAITQLFLPRLKLMGHNAAGVMACKPVLLHPILMSIVFEHYKQLRKISETEINEL